MVFLLPLIACPFVFVAAVYRLYTLPRKYIDIAGTLRLAHGILSPISLLTGMAYLGLLVYTAALAWRVAAIVVDAPGTPADWLAAMPVFAGYPITYIAAEWVFYYGFQRPPRPARCQDPS